MRQCVELELCSSCCVVLFANSQYRSTHFLACSFVSQDHEEKRRFSDHGNFLLLLRKFWIQTWFGNCQQYLYLFSHCLDVALVIFGLLTGGAHGCDHLSTRKRLSVESHFNGPIRFPQHLPSVHDHGRRHSDRVFPHLSPALTLA